MRRFPLPLSRCTLARDVKLCAIARGGAAKSLSSRLLARGGTKLGNIVLNYSFERFPRVYTSSSLSLERTNSTIQSRAYRKSPTQQERGRERRSTRARFFARLLHLFRKRHTAGSELAFSRAKNHLDTLCARPACGRERERRVRGGAAVPLTAGARWIFHEVVRVSGDFLARDRRRVYLRWKEGERGFIILDQCVGKVRNTGGLLLYGVRKMDWVWFDSSWIIRV